MPWITARDTGITARVSQELEVLAAGICTIDKNLAHGRNFASFIQTDN